MTNLLLFAACSPGDPGLSDQLGDDTAWVATFGATMTDEAWGLAALDDGGVVLGTHQSAPDPAPDVYVYRLDAAGELVWETRWEGNGWEKTFPVVVDGDVVYVGGTTYTSLDNADADAFVLALDLATGDLLDEWVADSDGYEEIDAIVPDGDHLFLSGWQTGDATSNDVLLASLSRDLELEWTGGYAGDGWDEANGGMAKIGDRLYVTGIVGGTSMFVGGEAMIAGFSATDGSLDWMETWTTDGFADGLGLASDGTSLFTVSMEQQGADGYQLGVRSWGGEGETGWATDWGGGATEFGRGIGVGPDGALVIAGTSDAAGNDDVFVLRLDAADGSVLAESGWAAAGDDTAHEVAVGPDAVFVAGQTDSLGAGQLDALLLRFPADLSAAPPTE